MDKINANNSTHKWHQLKELLLERIRSGDYDCDSVFCTQEELMAEHGVSYATVSRALSELVREGHLYRKRGVGTFVTSEAERKKATDAIGLLVWDREHTLEHPAFSRLVAGLGTSLREAGHNLSFLFANASQCAAGELAPMIRRAKISALVVPTQPQLTEASLRPVAELGVPIVPLNLDCPSISPCAIHYDIAGATRIAAAHLIECGYRKIVLMVPDNEEALPRTAGYQTALRAAGINEQIIFTELSDRPLPGEVLGVLGRIEAPVGLIASDDIAALTTVRTAEQAGWSVPDELGVVGVGNFMPPELFEAALTTVHVPFDTMGQMAADMALSLLAGKTPVPAVQRLSAELIVRDTTACLSESEAHLRSSSGDQA